ncbi:hypothetical protein NDU88_008568 [Pleurodeles waltl]|uniref:Uncharacterized protein n=1 Tax=Pleurodeles waltl TaxID=8319 RepID=A0AAV7RV43_PLEWA|nr:hypothetical protein NDU88_008568 [Pleurodeles waltl]
MDAGPREHPQFLPPAQSQGGNPWVPPTGHPRGEKIRGKCTPGSTGQLPNSPPGPLFQGILSLCCPSHSGPPPGHLRLWNSDSGPSPSPLPVSEQKPSLCRFSNLSSRLGRGTGPRSQPLWPPHHSLSSPSGGQGPRHCSATGVPTQGSHPLQPPESSQISVSTTSTPRGGDHTPAQVRAASRAKIYPRQESLLQFRASVRRREASSHQLCLGLTGLSPGLVPWCDPQVPVQGPATLLLLPATDATPPKTRWAMSPTGMRPRPRSGHLPLPLRPVRGPPPPARPHQGCLHSRKCRSPTTTPLWAPGKRSDLLLPHHTSAQAGPLTGAG